MKKIVAKVESSCAKILQSGLKTNKVEQNAQNARQICEREEVHLSNC